MKKVKYLDKRNSSSKEVRAFISKFRAPVITTRHSFTNSIGSSSPSHCLASTPIKFESAIVSTLTESKLFLEALPTRNVRKVILQTRKSFSPKKCLMHARTHSLRILPNIVAQEQIRAAEEWSESSVCYRNPVADGESTRREQVLS